MWAKFAYCVVTTNAENALEDDAEVDAVTGGGEVITEGSEDIGGGVATGEGAADLTNPFTAAAAPGMFATAVSLFIAAVADAVAAMIAFTSGVVATIGAALNAAYVAMSCSL